MNSGVRAMTCWSYDSLMATAERSCILRIFKKLQNAELMNDSSQKLWVQATSRAATKRVQVRILVEMPAWVLSVTLGSETVKQGVENAVFVSDADANIKRLPVSLTLDSDTCTIKYAI